MNIQIFGTAKCKNTQKAVRFFKERGITFHLVDLNVKPLTAGEMKNICQSVNINDLVDTEGARYKKRYLRYMSIDMENELLNDPLLLKTPIIRIDGKAFIGFDADKIKNLIK